MRVLNSIAIGVLSLLRPGDVEAQPARLAVVDVADLVVLAGVEVHEEPHDARHGAGDRHLLRAQQRYGVEAHGASRDRRVLRGEVLRAREYAAHDVGGRERVALEDLLQEPGRGVEYEGG